MVENRHRGATTIGTEAALRHPHDGDTLLMANSVNTTNNTFNAHMHFHFSNTHDRDGGLLPTTPVLRSSSRGAVELPSEVIAALHRFEPSFRADEIG